MRVRRLPVAVAAAVLGAWVFAGGAQACSCAPQAPRESLQEADAAIVGRLVKVAPHGQLQADYRYEVQRVYRGTRMIDEGQMLSVRSARRAAACALPRRMGRRYGLFLTRAEGNWHAGICAVVSPRRLWAAAQHEARIQRAGEPPSCA